VAIWLRPSGIFREKLGMKLGFDEDNPRHDTGATPGEIQGEAALAGGSNDRPSRYTGRLLVSAGRVCGCSA
jgi:hypothetical protein